MIAAPKSNQHYLMRLLNFDTLIDQAENLAKLHRHAGYSLLKDDLDFSQESGRHYIFLTKQLCFLSEYYAMAISLIELAQRFGYIDILSKDELVRISTPFRLKEIYSLTRICHQYPFLPSFEARVFDNDNLSQAGMYKDESVDFSEFSHFVALYMESQLSVNVATLRIILDGIDPLLPPRHLLKTVNSKGTIPDTPPSSDLSLAIIGVAEYLRILVSAKAFITEIDQRSRFRAAVWRTFAPEDDRRYRSLKAFFSGIKFKSPDEFYGRAEISGQFEKRLDYFGDDSFLFDASLLDFFFDIEFYEETARCLEIPILPSANVAAEPLHYLTGQIFQNDPHFHTITDFIGDEMFTPGLARSSSIFYSIDIPGDYSRENVASLRAPKYIERPSKPLDPNLIYDVLPIMRESVDTLKLEKKWKVLLKGMDLRRIGDVVTQSEEGILSIPLIGQVGLARIEYALLDLNLQLGMNVPDWEDIEKQA